jgi:hypothetical protein
MSQKKIHEFFQSKGDNNVIKKHALKKYFYLNFSNKFTPTVDAVWLDEKPKNVNFIQEINCTHIKKGYYYFLCGYFPDYDKEKRFNLFKETTYKNVAYLKSHLQKCIRKQNDTWALPTSYHFMRLNEIEFLRRLPIIMLEDVFLHESFSTIIWIMIAVSSTKFKMQKYIYDYIYGIIYVLCKIDKKDNITFDDDNDSSDASSGASSDASSDVSYHVSSEASITEIIDSYSTSNLKDSEISLLYSIHMRISYGGMKGDMIFLEKVATIWFKRFKQNTVKVTNMIVRPIGIVSISEMSLGNWDLSAIDFHCNNKLLEYIHKKYETISIDEIKKLIWMNSSRINTRTKYEIYNEENWNMIKDYVVKAQKYLLESSY